MIFRKDCFAPYSCDFEVTLSPMRLQMGFCIDSLGALNVKTVAEASSFCSVMLKFYPMAQQEIPTKERDPIRKVVQISTMVHPEKDWAFIALCDDGSLWLYHGSWLRIENVPQTGDV